MLTEEERQSIINEAVEKALLMLPEVIGNLIFSQAGMIKLNREFYNQHPEFAKSRDLTASAIEETANANKSLPYEEILKKSIPLIKSRLKDSSSLDVTKISKPVRDLSKLKFSSNNGEL
jgi:hypothetical protein